MIDLHVHFRDWAQADRETVAHGLSVAKRCGFTDVCDMPNTNPPLTDRETVLRRLALAEGTEDISYHVWMGLTSDENQIRAAAETVKELHPRVVGLKLFLGNSTGNLGVISYEEQKKVFDVLTACSYRGTVAVHAEKEALMHPELEVAGRFETHSLARPPEAEIESVRDVLRAVKESGFQGTLHVAHVSTAGAVALIEEAKKTGKVTMGVTPHHALWTTEDAKEHGRYLKMNPPLRSEADRKAVFDALLNGPADWMESDHAPHTKEQKEAGASGIPGLENMLLLVEALKAAGISEERLEEITVRNPARLFETVP